jgi:hypothetical protein
MKCRVDSLKNSVSSFSINVRVLFLYISFLASFKFSDDRTQQIDGQPQAAEVGKDRMMTGRISTPLRQVFP